MLACEDVVLVALLVLEALPDPPVLEPVLVEEPDSALLS
jgi:hypothetical protein